MKLRLRRIGLLFAVNLVTGSAFAAPAPADDFVRWPEVTSASIAEDGRHLAYFTPSGREYFNLNITDLESGKTERFEMQGFDATGKWWIDNDQILIYTKHPENKDYQIAVFSVKRGKVTGYLMHEITSISILDSLRRDPALFLAHFPESAEWDTGRKGLAIVSSNRSPSGISGVKDNRYMVKEWLSIPAGEYHGAATDSEGELRLLVLYEDKKMTYRYRTSPDAPWQTLPFDTQKTNIIDFDQDPDYLYVGHHTDASHTSSLYRYRVSTGEFGKPLYSDPYYSMYNSSLLSVRTGKGKIRHLALNYNRDVSVQLPIDAEFATVQKEIGALLPGRLNIIYDCDKNLQRFVISSTSGRDTPRFVIYNRKDNSLLALPEGRPWLNPTAASLMRPIKFKARDGLQLEGYLSLPAPRADGKKPPLIVNPHGGPWARDVWGFNTEVQFFTSRGYAVFQPNYRGSTGYNTAISKTDDFEFRKMHNDVTDGVRQLIAQGVVDGDRIAIFGGSFGGYLAVAGAAFEPDLYRCAITFAGVFDWQQLIRQRWTDSKYDKFNYDVLMEKLGDPKTQEERFNAMSPINHVAEIKCPVYVIHGKLDSTVNYKQSTRLLSELNAHDIPHEKLFFATEFHGFSERVNYREFLEAVESFLAKHL